MDIILAESGSGLFVKVDDVFYLKGIVSASLAEHNRYCDFSTLTLYTNVLEFTYWIKNSSGDTFEPPVDEIDPEIDDPLIDPRMLGLDELSAVEEKDLRSHLSPTEITQVIDIETTTFDPEISTTYDDTSNDYSTTKVIADICGPMSGSSSLIEDGITAASNLFPWTVAVQNSGEISNDVIHTGSLISNRHVVVGANFILTANITMEPVEGIQMFFGVTALDHKDDAKVIKSGVSKIILRKNYTQGKPFDANFAILVANKMIEFSSKVQPVCLNHQFEDFPEQKGFAVGWGFDNEMKSIKTKKYLSMKTDSQEACESNYGEIMLRLNMNSENFFCTTSSTNGTPCHADGPIYAKFGDKWYLQGLQAVLLTFTNGTCFSNASVLYEKATILSGWIGDENLLD